MSICVLNASFPVDVSKELDVYVDYRQGLSSCFDGQKMLKKVISWHSISVAMETEFFVYKKDGWQNCLKYDKIIVLVREDLEHIKPLISKLKLMKKKVILGFHENTSHFLLFCQDINWLKSFKELLDLSDYYWNSNLSLDKFISSISNIKIYNGTHGVPHEIYSNLSVPINERRDIIVGSRTISQWLPRNTFVALAAANNIANKFNCGVTYISADQIPKDVIDSFFLSLGFKNVNVIEGSMNYDEWLKTIARHKLLIHADQSDTLGQVVADACCVGVPAYGGNSFNNQIAGTNSFIFNLEEKPIQDLLTNFSDCWFNFELLKWETSYSTIRQKHEKFFI